MIEHSVFALPFAYLAALTAMTLRTGRVNWADLLLDHGRDGRRADVRDGRQPDHRPAHRRPQPAHRPAGAGHRRGQRAHGLDRRRPSRWPSSSSRRPLLNPLCLALAPLAVVPLVVYPYAKRFTDWPHAILGAGPGGRRRSAPGSRVTGTLAGRGPACVLGVAVGPVDRRLRPDLRLPGRRGRPPDRRALACRPASASPFALRAVLGRARGDGRRCSSGSARWSGCGWLWWIGLALTAAALVYEHAIVTPDDLSRVNRAFFTANGFVGIALFVFALADLVVRLGLRPDAAGPCDAGDKGRPLPTAGYGRRRADAVDRGCVRRLGHPVRRRGAARAARRGLRRRPGGVPGGPADDPGRDRPPVPRRALEGRPRPRGSAADLAAADVAYWPAGDLAAGPSSGSYPARGMVVVPASTAACAGIALGLSKDLLQRAAEVNLKERRPVVVVPRETPVTRSHLEHLHRAARRRRRGAAGEPGFYAAGRRGDRAAAGRLRRRQGARRRSACRTRCSAAGPAPATDRLAIAGGQRPARLARRLRRREAPRRPPAARGPLTRGTAVAARGADAADAAGRRPARHRLRVDAEQRGHLARGEQTISRVHNPLLASTKAARRQCRRWRTLR